MCAAVALTCAVKNPMCIDYPVFLPGSSAKSTAGSSGMKQHHGSLSAQSHLPTNCEETWPIEVPVFFAVQTVWAQSAIAAIKLLKKPDYFKVFNIERLHALCVVFNPEYTNQTIRNYFNYLKKSGRSSFIGALLLLVSVTVVVTRRLLGIAQRFFLKTKEFDHQYSGLADIGLATKELSRQLKLRNISWALYIKRTTIKSLITFF
jgi:hypothetical protein